MVDELNFCGGECIHGVNCATGFTHKVAIYVRSGNAWKRAISTFASGKVFLSTQYGTGKFKALVLRLFADDQNCPARGSRASHIGARETCDAVVKWDGSKFTYNAL